MFSKIMTDRFTQSYSERIERAAQAIADSDAVLIGAGAGLSAAAGLRYSGAEFEREFADYIERYGFPDLYTSSFHEFATEKERWTRWARHIDFIRYRPGAMPLYRDLLKLIKDKNYFVITTNVDAQFRKAGFEEDKIFEVQGDYGLMQCAVGCHDTLYGNREAVAGINTNSHDLTVASQFVPRCPVCGGRMDVHVRVNGYFIEDAKWHRMMDRYHSFVERNSQSKLVLFELGVGFNTPTIIRFPFDQMTSENPNAILIRMNESFPQGPAEIKNQTIPFTEDIASTIGAMNNYTIPKGSNGFKSLAKGD